MRSDELHTRFGKGDGRERNHLENLGVVWSIILKRMSKKWGGAWTGLIWLGIGTVAALVNEAMNLRVQSNDGNFLTR
jgi:hypothetical protein